MAHSEAHSISNVLRVEGAYSNDPLDPGGETCWGISRKWFPDWKGWRMVDRIKELGGDIVRQIQGSEEIRDAAWAHYRTAFWNQKVALLSGAVADELFEAGVNTGPGNSAKFLQTALNMLGECKGRPLYATLIEDGVIGRVTLAALKKCLESAPNAEELVVRCQNGEQYLFYKSNPKHRYFRGWFARV